jgi:RNA polymerase sigma factor (sigma-70 family)
MEHPDKKYIDALLTNDESLLKELYGKCFGKIRYFVVQNHGTNDDAWDLLQEAMLSIFYKLKQQPLKLTCPFEAFIYIICRNLWIKELRKMKIERVTHDTELVFSVKGEDDLALAYECQQEQGRRELLNDKLSELDEGCRQLLQQNWRGLQLNEVAVTLKISYGYARKKKTECMAKLIMLMKKSPQFIQLKW